MKTWGFDSGDFYMREFKWQSYMRGSIPAGSHEGSE